MRHYIFFKHTRDGRADRAKISGYSASIGQFLLKHLVLLAASLCLLLASVQMGRSEARQWMAPT
jgi:hypothetical protein